MFDRCVCFGLLSTLDDNLDRTFILSYRTFSSADASHLLIPTDRFLHSPFQRMYVRAAAERSLSGTPVHLLLVDAPNHAISMDEFFHAGLEPLRAFVCSYPMDVLLRASGQDCCPINGIMSGQWVNQRALSWINLDCATGSTAAYNTTRVFEQWPIFHPALDVRNASDHEPPAPPSLLLPIASATPYFLRSSDPSVKFFARPSARTFLFLLDFDLQKTFFRRPLSGVLFFGRLQYRHFLDDFNMVWPSGDLYHHLHIFSSGLFFRL